MNEFEDFYRGLQTHTKAIQELYKTIHNNNTPITRLITEHHANNYLTKNPTNAYNAGVSLAHKINKLIRFNPIKQSINDHIYDRQQATTNTTNETPTKKTLEKLIEQLRIYETPPKNPLNT